VLGLLGSPCSWSPVSLVKDPSVVEVDNGGELQDDASENDRLAVAKLCQEE
jgi:hypothetical protein